MILYDGQKKQLMAVRSIEREDDAIVIKGKIMGAMPMTARLYPEQARAALKLLSPRLILFLLTFLFRRAKSRS